MNDTQLNVLESEADRDLAQDIIRFNKAEGATGKYLKEVTPKERRLIKNSIKWPDNPMKACKEAGYNPSTDKSAYAMINKIKKRAEKTLQKELENAQLSADWIVRKLVDLANEAKRDSDKIKALELLGKYMKMFTEKVEFSGGVTNTYEVKVKEMTDAQLDQIIAGGIPDSIEAVVLDALPEGNDSASQAREIIT